MPVTILANNPRLFTLGWIIMRKPAKLNPGDKVAAITLSWGGAGMFPYRYETGKHQLEAEFGVTVVETPHALRQPDWIAANPRARADDLMEAFADPSIKAVFSMIGGEDSIRILPYIDLDVIGNNPKIFMGYSDTTITHFACWKAGVGSFYGPSFLAGFAENMGMFTYMVDSVRRTLFSADAVGEIKPNMDGWTVEGLDWAVPENQKRKRVLNPSTGWRWLQGSGVRQGRLIGGCIEVLDWLRGTDYFPSLDDWQDAILFLEVSEDSPSPKQVSYMLRSLAAIGILKRVSGILFGRPGGNLPIDQFEHYDQALLNIIRDEEGLSDLPIVTQMDFGHTDPMFVLPYGVLAEIDCDRQKVRILEAAVTDTQ
jgi:muramoyltetrapeptide carboxypeptidase LdcA involved in peptidoglycan recycling